MMDATDRYILMLESKLETQSLLLDEYRPIYQAAKKQPITFENLQASAEESNQTLHTAESLVSYCPPSWIPELAKKLKADYIGMYGKEPLFINKRYYFPKHMANKAKAHVSVRFGAA